MMATTAMAMYVIGTPALLGGGTGVVVTSIDGDGVTVCVGVVAGGGVAEACGDAGTAAAVAATTKWVSAIEPP